MVAGPTGFNNNQRFTMKNGRYSEAQIMAILKQAVGGVLVSELCREHGMSSASFYSDKIETNIGLVLSDIQQVRCYPYWRTGKLTQYL